MARGDHWWNEPPWWAWVTMAVSLVAIIVMLPFALNREPPRADSSVQTRPEPSESPATTGPADATTSSPATSSPADDGVSHVLVVGDADTAGFAPGSEGWPAVLQKRFPDVEMTVATTGDDGYVTTGAEGDDTLTDLVEAADLSDVDVVVLFGSRFDAAGIADQVGFAAGLSIGAIGEEAPGAELVVIGPAWPDDAPPAGVRNNRGVIQDAAETAGAVFVDPLAEGWLSDTSGLVGADGVHLTAAADTYLADRIEPLLRQALAA